MAEIRHACEGGLTAGCFAAYPQFAKKVFAYRLMHTLCPARMTKKLRESLWRALVRFPISWIPFEYFIFPPGFNTKLLFPPGWEPGDPLPPWIVLGPGASFPPDWRPGDPLPRGVTVDLTVLLSPDWTPGDELPPGVEIDPDVIFPPDWTPGDPLPFGITVDPEYRIQIPQLKLMYIYIEPGKTWEQVFPDGWDPTGPLPEGASWNPYLVFPGYIPAADPSIEPLTPEQEQEAVYRATGKRPPIKDWTSAQRRRRRAAQHGTNQPLYMGPWEPGPVHRPYPSPVAAADYWESFNGPAVDTNHKWFLDAVNNVCGAPTIVGGKLTFDCDNPNELNSKHNEFEWDGADDWAGAAVPAGTTLRIKVSANSISTDDWGTVCLWVSNAAWTNYVALHFAVLASYPMEAYDQDIGDNGGAEMVIDLTAYGITSVDYLVITAAVDQGVNNGHADYEFDYIHFE